MLKKRKSRPEQGRLFYFERAESSNCAWRRRAGASAFGIGVEGKDGTRGFCGGSEWDEWGGLVEDGVHKIIDLRLMSGSVVVFSFCDVFGCDRLFNSFPDGVLPFRILEFALCQGVVAQFEESFGSGERESVEPVQMACVRAEKGSKRTGFKAHGEGCGVLGFDDSAVSEICRIPMNADGGASDPEQQIEEMDALVDENAAAFAGECSAPIVVFVVLLGPIAIVESADGDQVAEQTFLDNRMKGSWKRIEPVLEYAFRHQIGVGGSGGDHPIDVSLIATEAFFAQNVFSGGERSACEFGVGSVIGANGDSVDIGICKDLCRVCRPAWNAVFFGRVFRTLFDEVADHIQASMRTMLIANGMERTDNAATDNGNPDRRRVHNSECVMDDRER